MDLPQDCWELIFKSLPDERHFESISLVSHSFLSITNNLRSSLKITHQPLPLLRKLFLRFKKLKRIDLSHFHGDPDAVLHLVSLSELDLKSVNISNLRRFPLVGLRELGSKMKNLKELNCSKIQGLQDADLFAVSDCCLSLEALDISFPLYGIVDSFGVTDSGVVSLLKNRFLEYLNLEGADFLNDGSMIELSHYLSRLKSINLGYCSKLTNSTFFTLLKECPVLSEISMETTNLGVEESTTELVINPRIKSLHLARNQYLSDEFMKKVALICPNLQLLDVSGCKIITEEGIGEILKSCGEIQWLKIESCKQINSLGIKHFEVKKVMVLQLVASGINDDALITIANTCPRLLYLNLSCCKYVTTRGIKEVLEKCRALTEIDLYICPNVDANILPWMVISRPSLRRIGWPSMEDATEYQRNLLLSHGCGVSFYLDKSKRYIRS
ncbi:hypothetical protein JRO89_XS04G0278900 [Xanthoceras sorbifolium]|uniref:F-box/LRR-repeat protein 15-like leucin rich repeat domain-containing protein n=1 Tax=Xanthoceras sorbifolium TaxID=99658 RepID=A0ABQ8I7H9_9ROSI|nr:hypothetical protein JRO89_XS04G0278900 [Xanthoceras sorbifolium]